MYVSRIIVAAMSGHLCQLPVTVGWIIGNFRSEYEYDYEYEFFVLSTRTLINVDLET